MKLSATTALLVLMTCGSALAQPLPPGASRGVPSSAAVDPAPGAQKPYLGHHKSFYDPMERLHDLQGRVDKLQPRDAARARTRLDHVRSLAEMQRRRHGGHLRDWDRERMMRMMNDLVRRYPELAS